MEILLDNLEKIEAHNRRTNETYEQELCDESDMTFEERFSFKSGAVEPTRVKRGTPKLPKMFNKNFVVPSSGCKFNPVK